MSAITNFLNQDGLNTLWSKIKTYISNNTVAKETGKGLSTNDFTAAYKSLLDSIDSTVGDTSHLVKNSAVNKAISDLRTQIGNLKTINIKVVTELPTSGQESNVIYLIKHVKSSTDTSSAHTGDTNIRPGAADIYDEYLWVAGDGKFEKIGNTDIAASNVTYNHSDSKLDATNVQQAIDEVYKRSNYNDYDNIIDFNTIHLITDNPEFICVVVDANDKILYGIKTDGQPYFGIGCPKQVKDYIDEQINKILGTDDITTTIDSLKEIEAFLKDFTNSDTLKKLLDLKANVDEVKATTDDIYKKSNPNDSEGNVIDTNAIISIKDNPEYIKALTDSVGKLIEAIGIDGIRKFFAGINIQGTLQCVTDNPEYIAAWIDNTERLIFGFKINGDPYFGYGVPSQINSVIEALKSNTEARIDALQQSIDNNILALDYNSDTGELYALTGETSNINASMDDNGDVYLEQEII